MFDVETRIGLGHRTEVLVQVVGEIGCQLAGTGS